MQTYSNNPTKNNKRRKETTPTITPKGYCLRFQYSSWDYSSNHLMFKCLLFTRKDLNTKQMRQSNASLLTTNQNIEKIVGGLFKAKWYELGQLWLRFLSGVNRRTSCMLSHYLPKTVYLFVNTFTLHGLFSAEFYNTNTTVNVEGSVVHGSE